MLLLLDGLLGGKVLSFVNLMQSDLEFTLFFQVQLQVFVIAVIEIHAVELIFKALI